jgi:hypothetical protein
MAKELGMSPRSLLKNIPSPQQRWKQPVKEWVRACYEKRFGKPGTTQPQPGQRQSPPPDEDFEIPF